MKRAKQTIVIFMLAILLAGCTPIQTTPQYGRLIEQSNVNVAELNSRCQAGDDVACKEGLSVASETLNLIVAGMHGEGGDK